MTKSHQLPTQAVLDAAAGTPTFTKRRSTSDHKDRRDSYFIRQLDTDENDTTIKYHTKAPDQPESKAVP